VFELCEARRGQRRTHPGKPGPAAVLRGVQGRVGFEQFNRQVAPLSQQFLDDRLELRDKRVGAFG